MRRANRQRALAAFSPKEVSKAVLRESLQRPYVLYPTAVGVLGGLAALVLGPSTLVLAAAAAGLGVGVGSWAIDWGLLRGRRANDYLRRLHEAMTDRSSESVRWLTEEFRALEFPAGESQLVQLQIKFTAFRDMLRRKLDPSELSFGRYQAIAEQVFLSGLDNLTRIADSLKSLTAIDPEHIEQRLRTLATDGIESAAQDREIKALNDRLALRQQQLDRIDDLLAENEAAMTHIDHVMTTIANADMTTGHVNVSMESAMGELSELAERARNYASTLRDLNQSISRQISE